MHNLTRLRQKWKAELSSYLTPLASLLSKPVQKLVIELVYGILSSGSVRISEIGRALKEDISLHCTSKRLSRMLVKHKLSQSLEAQALASAAAQLQEGTVLAIDPGDLSRKYAKKCEYISRVRDGSTSEYVSGYPMISVVARDKFNKTTPLLLRLYSPKEDGFTSENTEIMQAMDSVSETIGKSFLWVMDRGGDRLKLWDYWISHAFNMVVRVTKQRHWLWRNQALNAQDIAKQLPCKYRCKLRANGATEVKFGITTVFLPSHPYQPLSMVVIRHGKREPLLLVSTKIARGRRQGEALVQAYMNRWSVEEGYRFLKDVFGLETMMARKLQVMKNLVSLALLAWSFLAAKAFEDDALQHLGKADKAGRKKPDKRKKKVFTFNYYSISKGWKILFALAHQALRQLIRAPAKKACTRQVPMPFLNKGGLLL